jgi:hypothetical protein
VFAAFAVALAGCGGGKSSISSDAYRLAPAKACFEAASLETRVDQVGAGVRRLRVYSEGVGGPPYVVMLFTSSSAKTIPYADKDGEVRGNVVITGPGATDDTVTQCLLEAKQ